MDNFGHFGESAGHVHVGKGRLNLPGSEGGSGEEGSGDEAGGGDEEGAESPVDGIIGWTRVGEKRQLSQNVLEISHFAIVA